MEKLNLKKLRIGEEVKISLQQAKYLVGEDYNFIILLSGMDIEPEYGIDFPVVQNARFFIEKVKRAGTIAHRFEGSRKTKVGQFVIRMVYDYKHPRNFFQNVNNQVVEFDYAE